MLIDSNVLIYAAIREVPSPEAARDWFNQQVNSGLRIALPWQVLLAFQRITTQRRALPSPLSPDRAWTQIEEWLALPNVWVPEPTETHQEVLGGLIRSTHATGNLISDAHLAAIAIEHGIVFHTTDTDFARFPTLRWNNPLVKRA